MTNTYERKLTLKTRVITALDNNIDGVHKIIKVEIWCGFWKDIPKDNVLYDMAVYNVINGGGLCE